MKKLILLTAILIATTICNAQITINLVANNVSCTGGANGTLKANPAGGVSPYAYLWSNGKTSSSIIGLSAITYTVTVTDNNGATATKSKAVTQPATHVTIDVVTLNGDTATVSSISGGIPPYSGYLWLYQNGSVYSSSTSLTESGFPPGTYSVLIVDSKNCVAAKNFIIN